MAERLHAWLVSDGKAGNLAQAQALASWLELDAERRDIDLAAPWRWLSPTWLRAPARAIRPPLQAPWPDLAIGCGRRAAAALDAMPSASQGGPWRIQILDPHCPPARFDALVVPHHDGLRGNRIVALTGSLNPVDEGWLRAQRSDDAPWPECPSPRTLLLLGGPRRGTGFGSRELEQMLRILEHWQARDQGCLWISLSRRTPASWRAMLERFLPRLGSQRLWRDPDDGPNPYAQWLALADRIVVSPDSVNMLSEASATGKPVLTHAPHGVRGRLGELHRELRDRGSVRPLQLEYRSWTCEPLREGARVAAALRALPGYPALPRSP